MKKRKILKILIPILFVISFVCNGIQFCIIAKNNTSALTYEQFVYFFNIFNDNFTLNGYKNLGNNETPSVIYIDKEASFGKRNYLTLDDKQSALQTQKRIEFMKNDGSELVVIDLIYLDIPLYEDLLYWNDPLWNTENEEVKNVFTDNIISYQNILTKISIFSVSGGNEESISKNLIDITQKVVTFVNENKSKDKGMLLLP